MLFEDFAGLMGGWADMFRPFIESKEMDAIYSILKSEKERVVPEYTNTFRAFSKVYPSNLKIVWYLMD